MEHQRYKCLILGLVVCFLNFHEFNSMKWYSLVTLYILKNSMNEIF